MLRRTEAKVRAIVAQAVAQLSERVTTTGRIASRAASTADDLFLEAREERIEGEERLEKKVKALGDGIVSVGQVVERVDRGYNEFAGHVAEDFAIVQRAFIKVFGFNPWKPDDIERAATEFVCDECVAEEVKPTYTDSKGRTHLVEEMPTPYLTNVLQLLSLHGLDAGRGRGTGLSQVIRAELQKRSDEAREFARGL